MEIPLTRHVHILLCSSALKFTSFSHKLYVTFKLISPEVMLTSITRQEMLDCCISKRNAQCFCMSILIVILLAECGQVYGTCHFLSAISRW